MVLRSHRKGADGERAIVALARAAGLPAERTWHLAQSSDPSERCCDVRIGGLPYQVQISKNGFERMYREMAGVRGFIFRSDRGHWLVTLRLADYFESIRALNASGVFVEGITPVLRRGQQ